MNASKKRKTGERERERKQSNVYVDVGSWLEVNHQHNSHLKYESQIKTLFKNLSQYPKAMTQCHKQ